MVERRLTWLAGIVLLWGAAIFCKLVSLQVVHHQKYADLARARQELIIEIPAPRGTIFDRTGQPLAMSVPTESVYVNPLHVPDLGVASEMLALILKLNRTELYGKMRWAHDHNRGFLWIKRRISAEESASLRKLHLDWIETERESQRHYPKGTLAAHVLGSVDFEEKGNAGIERQLDDELRGIPGKIRLLTDVKRRGIDSQLATEAHAGTPITLSIDERIQFVAEQEIASRVEKLHARSGSVVVMNPYTGDILALASYPTYDPNEPPRPGDPPGARQNHAISVPFEPGSVFKVVTLSSALETTNLRPDTLINCGTGTITLFGRTIHEAEHGYGIIPMAMVLAKSSNVGAIQIGMRVGQQNLYHYIRQFGFGQRTGIPLPAESAGKVRSLAHWGKTSLASVSMGQEVSVTTLQLAQAASIVANGGLMVRPRLVLKEGDRTIPPAPPMRVLRPETAIQMRQMMEGVVLFGTGRHVIKLPGYTSGGKTGSAQIFDPAIGHFTHFYNGSFMGFAPVTNPAVVVVATLNGTHGILGFGGPAAGPVFDAVAMEALRVLDVPRDLPDEPPASTEVARKNDGGEDDLSIADLGSDQPNILEDSDDDQASASVQDAAAGASGPRVPNFRGMTMRAVLAEAAAKGLTVLPDGSGVARVQYPAPGAILRQGERIRVQFAR
ncbi:MAG TPA: penicillin-binding protein [Bryobacteraceae bacterium]|nr:penicillin-binding protein [Bryobacteraceae bacterium]